MNKTKVIIKKIYRKPFRLIGLTFFLFALALFISYKSFTGDSDINNNTTRASLNPQILTKKCEENYPIDCSRGSDFDGSVICKDGSQSSSERYKEYCSESFSDISLVSVSQRLYGDRYSILLRNNKNKLKKDINLVYTNNGKDITLVGPNELKPFQSAVYKLYTKSLEVKEKPHNKDFKITYKVK